MGVAVREEGELVECVEKDFCMSWKDFSVSGVGKDILGFAGDVHCLR